MGPEPLERFGQLARRLAGLQPDDCEAPRATDLGSEEIYRIEDKLFAAAADVVLQSLNEDPERSLQAAQEALDQLKRIGNRENNGWPEKSRFRFSLFTLPLALAVTLDIRDQASVAFFGVPQADHSWKLIDMLSGTWPRSLHVPREDIELSPLWQGPSKKARFLAVFVGSGCAAPGGEKFTAYQWDPAWVGTLTPVLRRDSTDSDSDGYSQQLSGPVIKIPYCTPTVVDSSLWPQLCSVDTFDLSGDVVKFVGSETNRPDLQVIARVIEYAQKRDLQAVQAYCLTARIARQMTRLMPSQLYFAGQEWKQREPEHEVIEFSDGWVIDFTLDKHEGRWFVSDFKMEAMGPPPPDPAPR